jgi:hypothetical protein
MDVEIKIETRAALRAIVTPFEQPSAALAAWQLLSSVGLYVASVALMYWSLHSSYLLTLALAVPTSGFLVRTFIVQHDCGHGSFFASPRVNDSIGTMCGFLTLARFHNWRLQHSRLAANDEGFALCELDLLPIMRALTFTVRRSPALRDNPFHPILRPSASTCGLSPSMRNAFSSWVRWRRSRMIKHGWSAPVADGCTIRR